MAPFSTVWLAKDQNSGANSYVAVKILTSNSSITQSESNIHKILSESQLKHSGKENFMTVLDSFDHPGPNGTHRCLVFDVMGPSAAHLIEELPDKFIETDDGRRYPTSMARSVLRQLLLGIDFLHQNCVAHGNIQPGNTLFSVKSFNSVDEAQLSQANSQDAILEPIERLDGKTDRWAPRYLALNQYLTANVDFDS